MNRVETSFEFCRNTFCKRQIYFKMLKKLLRNYIIVNQYWFRFLSCHVPGQVSMIFQPNGFKTVSRSFLHRSKLNQLFFLATKDNAGNIIELSKQR